MSSVETSRTKLIKQIRLMLADQMVDVELDPEHYNTAVDLAVERFRQRSSGANEESTLFLTLQPDEHEYVLPDEVQIVRKLYRRSVGVNTTGGTNFDPFEAAFSNIYLLQAGRTGGLATWEFFAQYQETIGRVFGSEINFTWDTSTKTLTLIRRIKAPEDVAVHVFNKKPELSLLADDYVRPWIRDYSLAQCKMMLGQAYSKFASGLPGPTGNVNYNGEQLKSEAQADFERLEQEILNFTTSSTGMPWIIA
jgi:hypothetical protein